MTKYIFVTGGVVSGLGKGITAASLGRLLKARGLKVAAQKLDPYINVDPGTMSPYQHGEVYVTEDGAETDLDLGHYERFIDEDLNKYSNLTTGKVYWNVLNKERRGAYLGSTVQIIPHITDEIKSFIYSVGQKTKADVVITEVGGTIGDIESQPFIEAIRQVGLEVGKENAMFIHVTLVPYLRGSREHKTKPTQHSVKELQGMGIHPDIIVLRSDEPIEDPSVFHKVAMFCNMQAECVIENRTLDVLYECPLMLEKQNFSGIVCKRLLLDAPEPDLKGWESMVESARSLNKSVTVALVGKYVQLHDAYLSVIEALKHAGYACSAEIAIRWIDSETVTPANCGELFRDIDGILVPGGFGSRGREGKILDLAGANSREFDENALYKVIDFMPGQNDEINKGGTLRLGAYPCVIRAGSQMEQCYGTREIRERHRHRYEFSNEYRSVLEKAGLVISGESPDGNLVETVELKDHPFFIGVQYHPEFKSRPNKPHPLFKGFVTAALSSRKGEDRK